MRSQPVTHLQRLAGVKKGGYKWTMRILVADDDAQTRQLLTRVLREDGHEVRAVSSCAGVDAQLPAGAFDVVVLDVMLPDGSGVALCSRLRASRIHVPI